MTAESHNPPHLSGESGLPACQPELLNLLELLVNVMFCMKGVDGRYLAVNAAFVRRTGKKSKRDVIGRRPSELFREELAERYEQQDTQVFETGEPLRDELEIIRREDGSLGWYLTTKLPVFGSGTEAGADEVVGLVSISTDLNTDETAEEMEELRGMIDLVHASLEGPSDRTIRNADLAAAAHCSESQLERRVRKVFGVSPTQYVLRVRVEHAARLLVETDRGLADIAVASGFYDQADFTRRFARLTNETPAQFRSRGASPRFS